MQTDGGRRGFYLLVPNSDTMIVPGIKIKLLLTKNKGRRAYLSRKIGQEYQYSNY